LKKELGKLLNAQKVSGLFIRGRCHSRLQEVKLGFGVAITPAQVA